MFLRNTDDILDNVAIVDAFDNHLTYGELEELSLKYYEIIPSRSLVMILCDYALETVAFYYCQMNNHVVPILVDRKLNVNLLLNLVNVYQPEYIWCNEDSVNMFDDSIFLEKYSIENHVLIRTKYLKCDMNSELALLLTTSGSTGSSKLVRISYANLRYNITSCINILGLQISDRGITTLPMHYCYGLSILHMHWMVGATIYVTDYSMLNIKFWEFFEKSRITNFAGISYTYDVLIQIGFFDKDYSSLRFVSQGGAKLLEEKQKYVAQKLLEKNIRFFICYGQTEATTYISILSHEETLNKLGCVGKALEDITVFVDNVNDKGEGELVCVGKSISLGYATNRNELLSKDNNLTLKTGDIVYIDGDGNIFIKGRTKRFVKILGERISLDEVEEILLHHYKGVEFACVGLDNIIKIFYTGDVDVGELKQFCKEEFSVKKSMINCVNVKQLPRSNSGKIMYSELEKWR